MRSVPPDSGYRKVIFAGESHDSVLPFNGLPLSTPIDTEGIEIYPELRP